MKIIHKNSNEEISLFPYYYKNHSIYGYLILTFDLKVIFNYINYDDRIGEINYEDVTEDFNIIKP